MADSHIEVTEGSGSGVDTRTEADNGHHRQVIVVGDPSTTAGVAPVDATAGLKVNLGADNDVTVTSGTITANLGATDNQVLDDISADTGTLAVVGSGTEATAQRVTIATDSTGVLSVDDNGSTISVDDGGGVLTVDGTVTAELSAVDNAVLDTIAASTAAIETAVEGTLTVTGGGGGTEYTEDAAAAANPVGGALILVREDGRAGSLTTTDGDNVAARGNNKGEMYVKTTDSDALLTTIDADTSNISTKIDTIAGAISGTEAQVDVVTSALPTGAATSAKQDTAQTSLDTIAGDTTAIQAAVEILDNAISGSEMQVDVVAALPAGTNAIGKLAANSGVDIGDVDVTSLPSLVAGTAAIGKMLPPDVDVTTHTNYAKKYYTNAGAVTDGIVWSPASGKRWHIVSLFVNVSAAATVTFEDDKAAGDEAVMKMELAANSGVAYNFTEKYPLASGEDAADLLVTTTAGNVYITVVGYEI